MTLQNRSTTFFNISLYRLTVLLEYTHRLWVSIYTHLLYLAIVLALSYANPCYASGPDSNLAFNFNFNNHSFKEENNQVTIKPVGVMLVEDRFGNSQSAFFLNGHRNSYLNLGTSPLLKPKTATVAIWVNINRRVYAGRGYDSNPIFLVKNGPGDDFIVAYSIMYECNSNRFTASNTKDSVTECILNSVKQVEFGKWAHLVFTSNNREFSFYVNGKLQGRCNKNFETQFLSTDSVLFGSNGSKKNERFTNAVFDDIQIFHRVLSEKEILDLYNAPDPNRSRIIRQAIFKWLGIAFAVFLTAYLLVWQRRNALKKTREKLELDRRFHELEIKTLKAQMNPHFIFNSLNSIQQFIMLKENGKAEIYLAKFSKLIRELLETNTRESLTVSEEIAILKGYLEMEALRFGASFSYDVTVDTGIDRENTLIPHMMVQPFAENAVWHGLLPKGGSGVLHINFTTHSAGTICCTVEDNGVGRSAGIRNESTFKKKSLALSFVRQRLELLQEILHIKCGVEIVDLFNENEKATGTRVIIILPVLKN
jgi:Histidine kinase/Concanavalin A-like lectin/glucanases superfamily